MTFKDRVRLWASDKASRIRNIGRPQLIYALRLFLIAIFAQCISALLTSTGIFSTLLVQNHNTNIPTLQNSFNYAVLVIIYLPFFLVQKLYYKQPWNMKWWMYILISIADVEANYLVVKAYEFTSITSIMLLDCFTIPCVMVLSRILLKRRFYWTHIAGVIICVVGIVVLVIGDYIFVEPHEDVGWTWSRALLGDALCIGASICYAISNVAQEFVMKREELVVTNIITEDDMDGHVLQEDEETGSNASLPAPPSFRSSMAKEMNRVVEFLAMLGIFGSMLNTAQLFAVERNQVFDMQWSTPVVLYLLGFGVSLFLIYSLIPHLLHLSSATFMNISFLTSDLFAIFASVFLFKKSIQPMFYVALVVIVIGLFFYSAVNEEEYTKQLQEAEQHPSEELDTEFNM